MTMMTCRSTERNGDRGSEQLMAENKMKILYLMRLLLDETDPAHPLKLSGYIPRSLLRNKLFRTVEEVIY